ncbi:rhomboid family intramembrane serine protease [Streptomyces viridiviolaceus]|uniref:Rhomboid family intramembrane serine protease n=1 Tax=Streptomyces viridiviolaceus TaxID=68282 RepID=A0ABW2E642_9ACTN|nr:rhomboid family intramembrane serine protease [Streptomyces viridiviolaceus]GHB60010.1 rhomboid family intramembrane serine protease [Streptomyces viridiviolaceus]
MIRNWSTVAARTIGALGRTRTSRGSAAPVTYGLIALCCLLFLVGPAAGLNPAYGSGDELLAAQRAYFRRWGVIPADLFEDSPRAALTPATALFVHGSWVHLLGNMLFLYVFGALTEERMGRLQFALFYLGCGYLALLGYAAANAGSEESLVGASGAISAVLGAFLFLLPRARVTSLLPFLFFLPLRFPAWLVLPFWAALQWTAAGRAGDGPGVAYLAHLVGFGLGFVFAGVRFGRATRVRTAPATAPEGENQP